jgi:hypothetical protein
VRLCLAQIRRVLLRHGASLLGYGRVGRKSAYFGWPVQRLMPDPLRAGRFSGGPPPVPQICLGGYRVVAMEFGGCSDGVVCVVYGICRSASCGGWGGRLREGGQSSLAVVEVAKSGSLGRGTWFARRWSLLG